MAVTASTSVAMHMRMILGVVFSILAIFQATHVLAAAPTVAHRILNQTWSGSGVKSFQVPLNTFADSDGDTLRYSAKLASGAALPAWLRFAATTRTFSGNPPAGLTALSLKVTANDGHAGTASATFTLSFSGVNDPPVAVADTLAVTRNQAATDTLTATDGDGDRLTYAIVTNGTRGRAVIRNATTGAYTYTPNSGVTGTDRFTFKVNDGRLASNTATVTVTIRAPNDAPVAAPGTLSVNQNTAGTGRLSASDANGDALTYALVTNGSKGSATLTNANNGSYRYVPRAGVTGSDSFTFKVNDGQVDSNTATVAVTIQPVLSTPAPVPATGQILSYFSGDDGALRKGVAWPGTRFADNGDGTVTDNLTGLVWMTNANCWGRQSWSNALAMVAGLNDGSERCAGYATGTHTDWRLPNLKEMKSLIDRSRVAPGLPAGHPFSGVQSDYYWSSTSNASRTNTAWVVYLGSGFISNASKTPTCYVWPVRGGS
ncbi:MAG: tandem-95 repeat protein [Magnetococcales bacterium]|nr:tandem-95 repeat protein [Magnetococcales bacterium]